MPRIRPRQLHLSGPMMSHREMYGWRFPLGFEDKFYRDVYSSVLPCTAWDHKEDIRNSVIHGGVFNLEFSQDGKMLVAACERKSVLMFDPLCRSLVHSIDNAHGDCVNCVRFLDSRMFATCSDDLTVALWDARNLKQKIRTLRGHSNWVKNIEYSCSDGLLITSGFDGSIYTWDINRYTEGGLPYSCVFHTNGLMRTRMTPDASKMVICTTGGYLMVIHDLDLFSLSKDLTGFKPNMYRLMQISQTAIPIAANYTHLFNGRRNRVEFITDFPKGNNAEVISSLQVHPQGWCVLSRNTSSNNSSEWSCVHDIQERLGCYRGLQEEAITDDSLADPASEDSLEKLHNCPSFSESLSDTLGLVTDEEPLDRATSEDPPGSRETLLLGPVSDASPGSGAEDRDAPMGSRPLMQIRFSAPGQVAAWQDHSGVQSDRDDRADEGQGVQRALSNIEFHITSAGVLQALEMIREAREEQRRTRGSQGPSAVGNSSPSASHGERASVRETAANVTAATDSRELARHRNRNSDPLSLSINSESNPDARVTSAGGQDTFVIRTGSQLTARTVLFVGPHNSAQQVPHRQPVPANHKIHENVSRLTHYIEEPNVGRGFIKELCFSPDGRLICSPFGYGIRLLAFNPECSELSNCVPESSVKLYELTTNICHTNVVVCSKFSPTHCLLVSGCLNGKIVWHQPVL